MRSIKDECLDRMIFVGQGALRRAITEFVGDPRMGSLMAHRRIDENDIGSEEQRGFHRDPRFSGLRWRRQLPANMSLFPAAGELLFFSVIREAPLT